MELMEATIQVEPSVQIEAAPFDHDAWRKEGEELGKLAHHASHKLNWEVGDWVLRGERHFRTEQYNEAEKITGLKRSTLQNITRVAKAFPPGPASRRREALTFSHHELVATLQVYDQEHFLDEAQFNGYSIAKLREHIELEVERQKETGAGGEPKPPTPLKPPMLSHKIRLSFCDDNFKFIQSLAKARKIDAAAVLLEIILVYVKSNKQALDAELERAEAVKKSQRAQMKFWRTAAQQ